MAHVLFLGFIHISTVDTKVGYSDALVGSLGNFTRLRYARLVILKVSYKENPVYAVKCLWIGSTLPLRSDVHVELYIYNYTHVDDTEFKRQRYA
jgi:hypothetical protein